MLSGKQVELTHLVKADCPTLLGWINDRDLVRFSAPYRPVHEPSHNDWFDALADDRGRVIFAIRSKPGSKLLGTVQLTDFHEVYRHAQMQIRIGDSQDRGRGIGTEALQLLLDFAWRDRNLHRVSAQVFARNERASACYRKAGFIEEGRLKDNVFIDGQWDDLIVMGIINPSELVNPLVCS
jgi:RimJ/RimL family protein N-acetyltransferase